MAWHAFRAFLPASAPTLEIGPYTTPRLRGREVRYFDLIDRESLVMRARKRGHPCIDAPAIHYVNAEGDVASVPDTFDAVFSSHCIEHTPDLIAHLRGVASVLEPGARYFVIVPDKRYCFDQPLSVSSLIQVHAAIGRTRHSAASIFRHCFLTGHNDSARHWADDHVHDRPQSERESMLREAQDDASDVHAWQFTPASFAHIIQATFAESLQPLRVERIFETPAGSSEFCAILSC